MADSFPPATIDMTTKSAERCASPEQIPHLEPLTGPNSAVNSVHDLEATTAPCRPVALHGPGKPGPKQNIGTFMGDVTAPLKLSLVLENRGNVARDHLASERTYLAYVRTSLACAGAGVAVVQLLMVNATAGSQSSDLARFAKPLGATIILSGILILVFGLVRYFGTQSALVRGEFPVARHSVVAIALVLGALVCTVFAVVFAGVRGS